MSEERPNPDQLLEAIRKDEQRERHGRLKIFLGMAAGVGKTYAMLKNGHQLREQGVDVVVGYVETHGRAETAAQIGNLPIVPRRVLVHRGVAFGEMDLDAVLRRHPEVVLVDELAHTNVAGSRHAKRYLDVLELLDAGIDVITTVNVQHLESRASTVQDITGVAIQETVPDSVVDHADEIVVVDLPPEELIKRLEAGLVYPRERAQVAARHFFKRSNLTALREMSLRLTAERVDRELRDIKQAQQIRGAWKSGTRIMVAVFASPYSNRLIRWTRRLADLTGSTWLGAYVETGATYRDEEKRLLADNLALVHELNGEVVTTTDSDIVAGLIRLARENNVTQIVVGKSRRSRWRLSRSLIPRLLEQAGDIDIYVFSSELKGRRGGLKNRAPLNLGFDWYGLGIGFAVVLGVWLLCSAFGPILGYEAVGFVFLIAVIIAGLLIGRAALFATAILSGLIWDVFFIPPLYTFTISKPEDYMMLVTYFLAAGTISHLTSRLRRREAILRIREERATALAKLTQAISSAQSMDSVLKGTIDQMQNVFGAEVAVLLKGASVEAPLRSSGADTFLLDEKEMSVASWVAWHGRPAGRLTDTLPNAKGIYIPLVAPTGVVGVLALNIGERGDFQLDQMALAETFARQIAIGIEREVLHETSRRVDVMQQSQRLYQALFDSVSHELKTPLATIKGAASALLVDESLRQPEAVRVLGEEIYEGAERLLRLVNNLLDMTRVDAGMLKPRIEMHDLHDLVGVVLGRLEGRLRHHEVKIDLPADLPLVRMDIGLIEQALGNIVQNAAAYSPDGTPIELSAKVDTQGCTITVRDHGRGLPSSNPYKVFEKFYRAAPQRTGGSGLGLTIAKGFVEAHKGSIEADNAPGGGAVFRIHLPAGRNA